MSLVQSGLSLNRLALYTVPAPNARRGSFVIAGGGDMRGGEGSLPERIVRYGETSSEAMRDKLRYVVAEMEQRANW